MEWQPIATCPKHVAVLFYREDAGIFFGMHTYCADWVTDEEIEREQFDEETLYQDDVWAFNHDGAFRCDGDLKPTHWMTLPDPPA